MGGSGTHDYQFHANCLVPKLSVECFMDRTCDRFGKFLLGGSAYSLIHSASNLAHSADVSLRLDPSFYVRSSFLHGYSLR